MSDRPVWRAVCPHCAARMQIRSELAPDHPRASPPDNGDAIRCDACGNYSIARTHDERSGKVNVVKIEVGAS